MGMINFVSRRIVGFEGFGYSGAPAAFAVAGVDEETVGWSGEDVAFGLYDFEAICMSVGVCLGGNFVGRITVRFSGHVDWIGFVVFYLGVFERKSPLDGV